MNAILSLCHFCEIHGPTVLLSTQAFHYAGDDDRKDDISETTPFFGPIKKLGEYSTVLSQNVNKVACEACNSVNGYITNDYENKISYLSTKFAVDKNVASLLKQAAIRSLSCEVVPGKEGQIYFGDSVRGHVLSHTFFLKDTKARGFNRWYSVIVFMRDKHFLLNSWPFFQKHIKKMVIYLQNKAIQVYTNEQNKISQRAFRLAQDQTEVDIRSLVKLTGSPFVFAKIHLWFSWLLSVGATRLEEELPTRDLECDLVEKEECEGFIIVEDVPSTRIELNSEEIITEVRKFRSSLGMLKFQCLVYSAVVGHQIVIRGSKNIVIHIINLLKYFIPKKKFRCLEYIETYATPDICNIIGLSLCTAVPKPTSNISRLDVVPLAESDDLNSKYSSMEFKDFELVLKTAFEIPAKWPKFLVKADKALSDTTLNDRVVFLHLNSLMEEWTNITEVIKKVKNRRKNPDVVALLQCLGVQDQDDQLIEFWTS